MLEEGYGRYSCDVASCQNSDFAQPHSDGADAYVVRRRIDAQGVERQMMVCSEHAKTYAELVSACDAAYDAFTRDGSMTLASAADIDELRSELSAMTSNRDSWIKKYKALKAEYEAYRAAHSDDTTGGDAA